MTKNREELYNQMDADAYQLCKACRLWYKVSTNFFNVNIQHTIHVGRQLGEQRPEAEVLSAVRQQDRPEREGGQDAQPRGRHGLKIQKFVDYNVLFCVISLFPIIVTS